MLLSRTTVVRTTSGSVTNCISSALAWASRPSPATPAIARILAFIDVQISTNILPDLFDALPAHVLHLTEQVRDDRLMRRGKCYANSDSQGKVKVRRQKWELCGSFPFRCIGTTARSVAEHGRAVPLW